MDSDNKLIRKIKRKNDRKAADELLGRYYREIFAFAFRQVQERELAMDLTQDIFIAVLRGLISFDERKAQFRTWLYTVASNKITDYYRSRYHRRRICETVFEAVEDVPEIDFWQEQCAQQDFVQKLLEKEMIQEVMDKMVQYDNVYVQIFQQKCFLERTFKEIAQDMGLSENTVKTRFYAIQRRLRKEFLENEK
ncbi:MAG: RNA polymerase sigma factor [Lachnospiraceae bacterium]|nr:RNA polymerase sigma factor [Lachnospiraceae bacterium]